MASMRLLGVLLINFALCITCGYASIRPRPIRHYVNGRQGWVLHPFQDYNQWAGSNRFLAHDTLYFRYKKDEDSVLEVNKEDYESCNTEHPIEKKQDGESEFELNQPGTYYFISGNKTHCQQGQKLIVQVLHYPSSSPSPPGSHHPTPVTPGPATSPSSSTPVTPSPATSPSSSTPVTPVIPGPAKSPSSSTPVTPGPAKSPSSGTPVTPGPATSPSSGTPVTPGPATSPSSGTPVTPGPAMSPSSGTPVTPGPATSPSSGTPVTPGPATSPSSSTPVAPGPATSGPASSPSSGSVAGPGLSPSEAASPPAPPGPAPASGPGSAASGPGSAASGPGSAARGPGSAASGPGSAHTPSGQPSDLTAPSPSSKKNSAVRSNGLSSMGLGVLSVLVYLIMWLK